jgi:hypothetical protein
MDVLVPKKNPSRHKSMRDHSSGFREIMKTVPGMPVEGGDMISIIEERENRCVGILVLG